MTQHLLGTHRHRVDHSRTPRPRLCVDMETFKSAIRVDLRTDTCYWYNVKRRTEGEGESF